MTARYDAQINVTIEVPDEQALLDEYREEDETEDDIGPEQALERAIEQEQPTFEIGLSGASGFMVAVEKVTYLDG